MKRLHQQVTTGQLQRLEAEDRLRQNTHFLFVCLSCGLYSLLSVCQTAALNQTLKVFQHYCEEELQRDKRFNTWTNKRKKFFIAKYYSLCVYSAHRKVNITIVSLYSSLFKSILIIAHHFANYLCLISYILNASVCLFAPTWTHRLTCGNNVACRSHLHSIITSEAPVFSIKYSASFLSRAF